MLPHLFKLYFSYNQYIMIFLTFTLVYIYSISYRKIIFFLQKKDDTLAQQRRFYVYYLRFFTSVNSPTGCG